MRLLILHTENNTVCKSVSALRQELEKGGVKVDLASLSGAGNTPLSAAPYGVVCVVTEYSGWWKPQIAAEVDSLLKKTMRLEGKRGGAFVIPGIFGSTKALRVLMSRMEEQGIMVEDFDTLGEKRDLDPIAKRLQSLF